MERFTKWEGNGMIANAFAYERATSVDEAIRLLEESGGEATVLAGGHSILPLMKIRLTSLEKLIDIGRIPELKGVQQKGDRLEIGALTTHEEVAQDPTVRETLPALAEAAESIGDIQVRNRGTVGGNIAHADPASDLPALAVAFDANINIQTSDGTETFAAEEFFLGPLITAIPENSILRNVSFAIPPTGAKSTYMKFAHPATGYAVVGVAASIGQTDDGMITFARVGITGAGDVAFRAEEVERILLGNRPTEEIIQEAANRAADGQEMGSDLYASAEYRRHLCQVYTKRALNKLLD